jgi:predicted nucleic acid-binding protein
MIVVANAGPLIALARIGQIDLLRSLYGQVHIPLAVRDEVGVSREDLPGAIEVDEATWIHLNTVQDEVAVQLLRERLDAGESEAIVLAMEMAADLLLIDEARGRRVAETRGLKRIGTIGTLILAKKHGFITDVTPLLDKLQDAGFHMAFDLYLAARGLADEV